MSNISIIIQREFNERVRKKSFIITTLLMPLLMVALMAAPALIMQFSRGDEKRIAVIDESGLVAPRLESEKLKRYNIDNLQQILDEVKTTVTLQTFRNDKSQEEETHAQSSTVATVTGYVLGFILYMFLLIYGQMVMQSVIEEKNNRVLEVMVSSVRPFDLIMGRFSASPRWPSYRWPSGAC